MVIDFYDKIDFYAQKVLVILKKNKNAKAADIIEQMLYHKSMALKSAVMDRVMLAVIDAAKRP